MIEQVDAYWGLTDELNEAIDQVREVGQRADARDEWGRSAAYLLLCWGRCRLFEVPVDQENVLKLLESSLWSAGLSWFWGELNRLLKAVQDEAWLDEDLTLPFVRHAEPLDILKSRLYFQGVRLVLEDPSLPDQPAVRLPQHFQQRVGVFVQLLEDFDEAIDTHRDTLCVVAETAWPQNVAITLPEHAWQPRPWWLTEEAVELRRDVLEVVRMFSTHEPPGLYCLSPTKIRMENTVIPADQCLSRDDGPGCAASPDLRLACDANQSRAKVSIAEFVAGDREEETRVKFDVPADYSDRRLADLPSAVEIDVVVAVYQMVQGTNVDQVQKWRLRTGSILKDVVLKHLAPMVSGSVTQEWQGTFQLSAGDLRSVVREDQWPQVYLRRIQ
jgi:hypothetical protein